MELSKCGMVQFMAADFEVPLFTVERVGGVVVESAYGFHDGGGVAHRSGEADRISSRDLRPPFMQAALIEKYYFKMLNVMFFDIAHVGRAASGQERDGRASEEQHGPQPAFRCACGMLGVGVSSSQGIVCRGFLNHHEERHSTRHTSLSAGHQRAETTGNLENTTRWAQAFRELTRLDVSVAVRGCQEMASYIGFERRMKLRSNATPPESDGRLLSYEGVRGVISNTVVLSFPPASLARAMRR
jgi:hypothetical protein